MTDRAWGDPRNPATPGRRGPRRSRRPSADLVTALAFVFGLLAVVTLANAADQAPETVVVYVCDAPRNGGTTCQPPVEWDVP